LLLLALLQAQQAARRPARARKRVSSTVLLDCYRASATLKRCCGCVCVYQLEVRS
jgi:hypothetical protein